MLQRPAAQRIPENQMLLIGHFPGGPPCLRAVAAERQVDLLLSARDASFQDLNQQSGHDAVFSVLKVIPGVIQIGSARSFECQSRRDQPVTILQHEQPNTGVNRIACQQIDEQTAFFRLKIIRMMDAVPVTRARGVKPIELRKHVSDGGEFAQAGENGIETIVLEPVVRPPDVLLDVALEWR